EEINKEVFHPRNFSKTDASINRLTQQSLKSIGHFAPKLEVSAVREAQLNHELYSKVIKNNDPGKSFVLKNIRYIIGENQILYRITEAGRKLAIIPKSIGREIISYLHVMTMHSGKAALESIVRDEPIWIESKTAIIAEVTKECLACYIQTPEKFRKEGSQLRRKPALRTLEKLYTDIIELRVEQKSFLYMTVLDEFSSFLMAKRVRSKKAADMVPALMIMMTSLGAQGNSLIVSDNGPEFVSKEFQTALRALGMDSARISPYNSGSNLVERSHRDLRAKLRLANVTTDNVDFHFEMAISHYNHSPKASLKNYTPMEIFANISRPTTFSSLDIDKANETVPYGIEDFIENLKEHQSDLAKSKIDTYFMKTPNENLKLVPGDFVVILDSRKQLGHSNDARGPYEVTRLKYGTCYELTEVLTGKRVLRNSKFLIKMQPSQKSKEMLRKIQEKGALNITEKEALEILWGKRELVRCSLDSSELTYLNPHERKYNLRSRR
ncbi:unnamed protein product, partial [Oikopleura dioica]